MDHKETDRRENGNKQKDNTREMENDANRKKQREEDQERYEKFKEEKDPKNNK
jgi:hypothetical protein